MRWIDEARGVAAGSLALVGAMSLNGLADASVNSVLTADTYLVRDAGRTYSVLDIYVRGSHIGDSFGSVTGLNGTAGHPVVFATSEAQGIGLVRNDCGKITSGTITSDIFVQAGGSGWCPGYPGCSPWDSFVSLGARTQIVCVTNRSGVRKCEDCTTVLGAPDFQQFSVPNSNYINNGGGSGWYSSLGWNPYSTVSTSENPFARVALYWSVSQGVYSYPDLPRTDCTGWDLLRLHGRMQTGRPCVTESPAYMAGLAPGGALDGQAGYFWMVGRFSIDVTDRPQSQLITMNVQFNMVGRTGTGNETGTTFTGATTPSYKVSQFFNFAMPCKSDLDGNAVVDNADVGLMLLDFGPCAGCGSDLDGNGVTDNADVGLLLLDSGACPS